MVFPIKFTSLAIGSPLDLARDSDWAVVTWPKIIHFLLQLNIKGCGPAKETHYHHHV